MTVIILILPVHLLLCYVNIFIEQDRSVKQFSMKGNFELLVQSDKPVLVDVYDSGCYASKLLNEVLKQVKRCFGNRISIVSMHLERNRETMDQLKVNTVPTVLLYQKGAELWRHSGILSKESILLAILEKAN